MDDAKNTTTPSVTEQSTAGDSKRSDTTSDNDDKKKQQSEREKRRNPTVTFNVGGTKYEVSLTLLNIHPHCLLSKEADKPKHQDNPDEPIFIDRDGSRCKYVLDWMRDNQVVIPATVSKKALLNELHVYGFDSVDESTIDDSEFLPTLSSLYFEHVDRLKKEGEETRRKIEEMGTELRMKECAFWFFDQIKTDSSKVVNSKDCGAALKKFEPIKTEVLRKALGRYGLQIVVDDNGAFSTLGGSTSAGLLFRVGRNFSPTFRPKDAWNRRYLLGVFE